MAHHTYRTEGLVLSGTDTGEGSRYLALFTEELGFVEAHARSVREMRSKLRYHTQEYTLVHVGLVRGHEMWRLTNAVELCNSEQTLRNQPEARAMLARICALLRRLLHGEERNEYLFAALKAMIFFLCGGAVITERDHARVECVTLLRILYSLGYLEKKELFSAFLEEPVFHAALLSAMGEREREAVAAINNALHESQL